MKEPAENALVLLEWYRAMGVDEAIAEAPLDWYAPAGTAASASKSLGGTGPQPVNRPTPAHRGSLTPSVSLFQAPAVPAASAAGGADIMAAREVARSAQSLEQLRHLLEGFEGCALKKTASTLCLSRGAPDAKLMLIGEAPGKEEDACGLPFVGRAGRLLDKMLGAIGLSEADVYVTNLVFWRPPGNRTPTPEEVQVCQPFVERQIELLAPDILVFLGNAAAKQLTGATEGIMKLRGKWLSYPLGEGIAAMATLHPAYLLRNPIAKRLAWRDLIAIREALDLKS
jgi:DNA polymerase